MAAVTYGYARVSAKDQNLDRQLIQLREYGIEERNILMDKVSGKDFNRKAYNSLVGGPSNAALLREGDLLVITSLDRLGRNYSEILAQWRHILQDIKANIKVLDMPLLDTSGAAGDLDRKFIVDLTLQILSYIAEKERQNIKIRQRQGIEAARLRGQSLGRPQAQYPENWASVIQRLENGEIRAVEAMKMLGLKKATFYKLKARATEEIQHR